ncbi:GNAT family N-acetyltransferase [Cellulophaga baltica]|jgi:ribosomal protein S18 acetylase RimI-like enzyme|uniref:Transcriptional regulator n=1 Tax=Cellulophaga baltica 18 TaxID=1348584 RepID=A0AAU8R6T3_9FLAO|nr:GNAT family N-acetyltransferase [Cellulophaga baltica]AIZ40227.1 transcriptional regulator [Cellulophaga baltica 18]
MNITKATTEDSRLLSEIGKEAFLQAHGKSAPEKDIEAFTAKYYTETAFYKELNNPDNIYYLIYSNDHLAGYSKIAFNQTHPNISEKNITKLDRIYLLQEFHGQNLGTALFNHNVALSKKENQLGIWLYVWTENEKALRFYKKSGFKIVGSHDYQISETHTNPNYILFLKY